jgi:hypothetical protein
MSSSARMFTVRGSQFGAEPQPAERRAIPDNYFRVLSSLQPKTEERSQLLSRLLGERYELNARCQRFIDEEAEGMHAALLEAHEKIKTAARAQQQVIADLEQRHGESMREWHRAKAVVAEKVTALNSATAAQKGLGRFSPSSAIAAVKRKVEAAQAQVDAAREPESRALQSANQITMNELPRAKEKLEELAAEELRIRAQLAGLNPDMVELGLRPVGA